MKTNLSTSYNHWDIWIIFEIGGKLLTLALSVLCLIAFLKRRDITPRLMMAFYSISLLVITLDLLLARFFEIEVDQKDFNGLYRSMANAAIWIPFFLKSLRVKNTFIIPYGGLNTEPTEFSEQDLI
jgi:hypothetical protein